MKKLKMLEEGYIGSLKLKNRVIMAPMGYGLDKYGPKSIKYFEERCKGGAAMITTHYGVYCGREGAQVDHRVFREGIKEMAAMAHSYDTKACMMVVPGLGRVRRYLARLGDSPDPTYSASEVPEFMFEDRTTVAFTREEIEQQYNEICEAAKWIAEESGYDAILIHAYGGYLTDQFLSARWNKRTDEYGGDLKGRAKYLTDIIHGMRDAVGPDFPIMVKFTPCHYMEGEGYRQMDEGVELAKLLVEAGADALHVDAGCYENWHLCMPPSYTQYQTYAVTSAEEIKKHVNVPVIVSGKLGAPEKGEAALEQNKCDFISVGRGWLADSQLVNKISDGAMDDIRPCIGCDEGCIRRVDEGDSISCAVNPDTGFECYRAVPKVGAGKKLLVVGAGPGGITAAIDAKNAGYDVEIWEKRSRIGGLLTAAGRPSFKKEIADLVRYYNVQLVKMGIPVRYNMDASAEEILASGADEIILATGLKSIVPGKIPGIHNKNVVTAVDALNDVATLGKKLVMVGSGLVGCEAALHLSIFGKDITIIEMAPELMPNDVFIQSKNCVNEMIAVNDHISVSTSTKLLRIEEGCVVVEKNGQEETIPCDTVVLAMGFYADGGLAEQLKDKENVHYLGYNGLVLHATSAGREAVLDMCGVSKEVYTRPRVDTYQQGKKH